MNSPHSAEAYETPTILFQKVLVQAGLNIGTKKANINMKNLKRNILGKVFTQLNTKSRILSYGEEAIQALM